MENKLLGIKISFLIGVLFLSGSFVYAETVEEYYHRGNAYYDQGNFSLAIFQYTRAIEIDPKDSQAYFNRGLAYYAQNNLTQAILDFTKAIAIDPQHSCSYDYRGLAYYAQNNLTQAILDFTKAIAIDPKNSDAHNNRGLIYCLEKEYDKAWTDVHQIEELGGVVEPGFLKMLKKASGRDK